MAIVAVVDVDATGAVDGVADDMLTGTRRDRIETAPAMATSFMGRGRIGVLSDSTIDRSRLDELSAPVSGVSRPPRG